MTSIGIAGFATYFPQTLQTAADLAPLTGIPEAVLREKMGIRQRHVASESESVTFMASQASQQAIESAGISADQIKLVISHGSEYKDHLVWNAAAKIHNAPICRAATSGPGASAKPSTTVPVMLPT